MLAAEDRVLATIRARGLRWVGSCYDRPFKDKYVRSMCEEELNTMQGVASCLVEMLEGCRTPEDVDVAWQRQRVRSVQHFVLNPHINDMRDSDVEEIAEELAAI